MYWCVMGYLIFSQRLVDHPCSGEDFLGINDLEERADEICQPEIEKK